MNYITNLTYTYNPSTIIVAVFDSQHFDHFDHVMSQKKKVPFSMAIEKGELMHECFPKHLCMGTARIKLDKEIKEDSKKEA